MGEGIDPTTVDHLLSELASFCLVGMSCVIARNLVAAFLTRVYLALIR